MKCPLRPSTVLTTKSPPSRGAWIEILLAMSLTGLVVVAPLAGGVD